MPNPMILSKLDPSAVALEAARAATERASRLALPLSPSVRLDLGDTSDVALAGTDLAATFRALTEYAQKGLPVWDWTSDEDAADALLGAAEVMFSAPGRNWAPAQFDAVLSAGREGELSAPVLVLACAWTRARIARGEPVPLVPLARLASISYQRAHQYVTEGRLPEVTRRVRTGNGGRPLALVSAVDAREWLATHSRGPEERAAALAAKTAAKAAAREAAAREAAAREAAARAELADRIRAAAAVGRSTKAVAQALGVSRECLRRNAKSLGVKLPRGVPGRPRKKSEA